MRLLSESLALIPATRFLMAPHSPCAWREHPEAGNTPIRTIVIDLLDLTLVVRSNDATLACGRLSTQVVQ